MKKTMLSVLKLIAALMVLGFQNCGGIESNGFAVQSQGSGGVASYHVHNASFFGYPHTASPDLYGDLQVVALADTGSMHNFKVLAAGALADGSQMAINYSIEIRDSGGTALCPQIAGTLAPSYTTITGTCVSRQTLAGAKARLVLTAGAKTLTVERQY